MKVLLDTCSFLWIISDSPHLSDNAKKVFQSKENQVFLSAASTWEIIVKNQLGKLPLPETPDALIPAQMESHFITPLPIDQKDLFYLQSLDSHHRDPFDRILICQAKARDMVILTPDPLIQKYAVPTIW